VTSVLWLLPQALGEVLFPRVAALSASGARDMRSFVEAKRLRHTVLLVALALPLVTVPLLVLIVPVYGVAFRPAVELAAIVLPGVAPTGVAGVLRRRSSAAAGPSTRSTLPGSSRR
jgi:O-antigen/teichoic acid export membrane protein